MNFPLDLRFKILALASQISVRDGTGQLLCYVRQKMFRLREAVTVFGDEQQTRPLYTISADRVLDISAQYDIRETSGRSVGVVRRRGMRSLWRAHYEISRDGRLAYTIQEENPWVKLVDGLVGQIPIVGILTGYILHPAYVVSQGENGAPVFRAVKQPAFLEGRYRMEQLAPSSEDDQRLALMSVLMMLLLERQRG